MELNQALIRHGTACARSPTHILTDVHPSNDHRYGALGPIRAAYRRVGRGTRAPNDVDVSQDQLAKLPSDIRDRLGSHGKIDTRLEQAITTAA